MERPLFISPAIVRTHVSRLLARLHTRGRTQLAVNALASPAQTTADRTTSLDRTESEGGVPDIRRFARPPGGNEWVAHSTQQPTLDPCERW
ncbi:hypothetical protein [Acrocarpospora macrocephala]|uniref:hypothetical protein n=1 Tax=Acrocarpospora macrocephala TaxID=150177 RepID=UPI003CD092A8